MMKKVLLAAIFLTAATSFAKTKTVGRHTEMPPVPASVNLPLMNEQNFAQIIKDAKETKRRIAQAQTDVPAIEQTFSDDFKQMRAELIGSTDQAGVTTPAQLDAVIQKYSKPETFKALSPQAQFLALQLRSLTPFKSFIFRARDYIGKHDATRAFIVSLLRTQQAGVQAFFPFAGPAAVNHWDVVFKYVTEPVDGMGPAIDSDAALATFMGQTANSLVGVLNDLNTLVAQNKPIWWDNKLYMSFASFTSSKDRYVMLGQPELYSLESTLSLNLSGLYATTAYSLDGLQQSIKEVGQLFGIQTILGTPDGMSSDSRIHALKRQRNLFVKTSDGNLRMSVAYQFMVNSARAAQTSFELTKRLPEGQENLFDPRVANAFMRIPGTSFANIQQLLASNEADSTVINGEKIRVNIKAFYDNPPERLSNLYPVAWVQGPKELPTTAWGKPATVRNYKAGMAKAWLLKPYQQVFPDISSGDGKTTTEVPRYARVLTQSWGSAAFAFPMAAVIF